MKVDILSVKFDNLDLPAALDRGWELLNGDGFSYVVTPNPEIVNLARADEGYCDLLNGAALVLPDGIGIIYAAKILKKDLSTRVPGIDFACGLLSRIAQEGRRLFLLGAKPGVAERAAIRLREQYPGLVICGTQDGYFKDNGAVVEAIREAKAEIAFVCLGAPKQERWMATFGPESGVKLMLGLGGVLDVFSGDVQRAPVAFQTLGLEWFYRLLRQPSRLGRMMKLPLFLGTALRQRGKGAIK